MGGWTRIQSKRLLGLPRGGKEIQKYIGRADEKNKTGKEEWLQVAGRGKEEKQRLCGEGTGVNEPPTLLSFKSS